ncbi:MAG: hypothetical protein RLZZ200_926, partial [Pseudomonadota bacterium]
MHSAPRPSTSFRLLAPFQIVFGIALLCLLPQQGSAAVVANWGTIVTPLQSDVTFSFAQYDLTKNFTQQYLFSLEGAAGATYSVSFTFDACKRGCGNPNISYGIYDAN